MQRKSSSGLVTVLSALLILMAAACPAPAGAAEAIERIGVAEARTQVKEKTALLVCSYDDDRCKSILLEGAILQSEFETKLPTLARTQPIIFYCA
ncbi:MAG: hypothetical protein ACM3KE_20140 [Hyphomicrobiales bacterium]